MPYFIGIYDITYMNTKTTQKAVLFIHGRFWEIFEKLIQAKNSWLEKAQEILSLYRDVSWRMKHDHVSMFYLGPSFAIDFNIIHKVIKIWEIQFTLLWSILKILP